MSREVKRVTPGYMWNGVHGDEPTQGEGWQLWQTVTDGSPISPVCDSAESLAKWMTQNHCTVNGPMRSYDAALKFVRAGWAPSFVKDEQGFRPGTEW